MDLAAEYNLSEELTRKSGEAYSWLDNEYKRGQLSSDAFFKALVALDIALLGLIPKSYSEWACEQRKSLEHLNECDRSAFYSDSRLVVLTLDRAWGVVRMTAIVREPNVRVLTKEFSHPEGLDDSSWAVNRYRELRADIQNKGFTELK